MILMGESSGESFSPPWRKEMAGRLLSEKAGRPQDKRASSNWFPAQGQVPDNKPSEY